MLKADWPIRRKIVYLSLHPWFENFVNLMIVVNSITMAIFQYAPEDRGSA